MNAKELFLDYHLIDFLVLVVLMIVWLVLTKIKPNRLFVPKKDPRCSYPHYNHGISETQNLIIVVVVPYIAYSIIYLLFKLNVTMKYFRKFDFLFLLASHGICICVTNIIVNIIKIQVGRPRPDFFSVLGPTANADVDLPPDLPAKKFYEQFKSFPSGHSASASCGSVFFVLFLQCGQISNQVWVFVIICTIMIYPIAIGCTRITQHRHHPDDVIMGLFIGFLVSAIFFLGSQNSLFTETIKP